MNPLQINQTWTVMHEMVSYRVDVSLSMLIGRTRVKVDDRTVVDASGWRMGPGGKHIDFVVQSRQCTLVVRPKPADPSGPELDLHVDGWSLDNGTRLEERLTREAHSPSALMRMIFFFLPVIGIPNLLRGGGRTNSLSPVLGWGVVVAGLLLAVIGSFAVDRWYAARAPGRVRSTVGWLIVLACYAGLMGAYLGLLRLQG